MLNKLKIAFVYIKFILDSNKFKAIFLMLILTCFLNLFNIQNGIVYEEAFFSSITNTLFLFVLISLLFISSCITLYYFDKDYTILLRYENKLKYLKKLFISISIVNLIVYCFAMVITLLLLSFKYFGCITFGKISSYNMPFFIYNIFTMIKYFIVINILSLIGICVYKNFGKVFSYIYYSIILILYYMLPVSVDIIGNFSIRNLLFKYYIFPFQYANFYLELLYSLIYICGMMLLIFLFISLTIKYNKVKIDE